MNGIALLAVLLVGGQLQAATPPAALSQPDAFADLASRINAERNRLATQIADRRRALAELYAAYTFDAENAARIENEILDLDRERFAVERRLQMQLRSMVSEGQFAAVKKRLELLLEPAARPVDGGIAAPDRPTGDTARSGPERVFSGPQTGEKLPPLRVRGVFDERAGKELAFVGEADERPILLVFVHEANRPSIGLTRTLTTYAATRARDGLSTGVVWLAEDATEAENALGRMRHALTPDVPIGISLDGREGPGTYGLNRNVQLTILVAKQGRVTANFALVQPSIQADLPGILAAIVGVVGGEAPALEDLPGVRAMLQPTERAPNAGRPAEPDPRLRAILVPVIQLNADEASVERAAAAVEDFVRANESVRAEVGRIARTIVESGRLANYGTPRAQAFLRKWASEYGGMPRDQMEEADRVP
jgi:hypothetical protein